MHEMGWCAWMVLTTPAHQTKVRSPPQRSHPQKLVPGTLATSPSESNREIKDFESGSSGKAEASCLPAEFSLPLLTQKPHSTDRETESQKGGPGMP